MSEMFQGAEAPEVGNVDAQQPVEAAKTDSSPDTNEEAFAKAVEQAVSKRFKKHEAEKVELLKKISDFESKVTKKSSNVEQEVQAKLAEYEAQLKSKDEKLTQYRQNTLRATVERELSLAGCLDPELAAQDMLSKKLVGMNEDGEIEWESYVAKDLADVAKSYLDKKPHLMRATQRGGVGSKGPASNPAPGDFSGMTTDQMFAALGGNKNKVKMFGGN